MSQDANPAAHTLNPEENALAGRADGKTEAKSAWVDTVETQIASVVEQSEATAAPTGRPRKLTFRRIRRILRALSEGTPGSYAPACGGVDAHTWSDWCEQFPQLARLAKRAINAGVASTVREVRYGTDIKGNPDWKARAWLLERRHKEHFASPKGAETTVNVTNNTAILSLDSQAGAKLIDAYQQMLAAPPATTALPLSDR